MTIENKEKEVQEAKTKCSFEIKEGVVVSCMAYPQSTEGLVQNLLDVQDVIEQADKVEKELRQAICLAMASEDITNLEVCGHKVTLKPLTKSTFDKEAFKHKLEQDDILGLFSKPDLSETNIKKVLKDNPEIQINPQLYKNTEDRGFTIALKEIK